METERERILLRWLTVMTIIAGVFLGLLLHLLT